MAFPGGLLAVSLALFCAAGEQPFAPDWSPRLLEAEEAAEGFYPLYNGSDLDGWTVTGPDKNAFSAQGDVLVITGGGGGEWLVTTEPYEQFVLRYQFRKLETNKQAGASNELWDTPQNSRGASQLGVAFGMVADGPPGEWNEAEVVCRGDRIGMSVNDVPCGDAPARPGCIGIQDCGQPVEFRGIRIKPLPGGSGWRRWDGKGGDTLPESFELRLRFRPFADAQGGVVFTSRRGKPLFEVRIDNQAAEEFTGSLGGKAGALELRALDDCWNLMRIAVDGANVRVWVNGKTVVDFIGTRRVSCAGAEILFNVERGSIKFEDIEIRPKEQHHGD